MSCKVSTCKTRGKKELCDSVIAVQDMQRSKMPIYERRTELLAQ